MRKLALIFVSAAISCAAAFAQDSKVRNVDINVHLCQDGSALVCERWDVSIFRGTEWYLVRKNLGDIGISALEVTDESGTPFVNEGEWNVDRGLDQKAGRCGIVTKSDGCEICWGLGSHGDHIYTVKYRMSNVIKSADDKDFLHMQLVSPGISPRPQSVSVMIDADTAINDNNCDIWAFGFDGYDEFKDSSIVIRTSSPFTSDSHSVILLASFDKGMFNTSSIYHGAFQDKLENAMYGSSYAEYLEQEKRDRITILSIILAFAIGIILIIVASVRSYRRNNEKIFGVRKLSEIGYEREVPFGGDLLSIRYVLTRGGSLMSDGEGGTASAMILKMVRDGQIIAIKNSKGKTELSLSGAVPEDMDKSQKELMEFLKEAAGADGILQRREFANWSERHKDQVNKWILSLSPTAREKLHSQYLLSGKRGFSPAGQMQARKVVGIKNFLNDFTLIKERGTAEVALWADYIIVAAMLGIADKVARELKEIDPQLFEQTVGMDYPMMRNIIFLSDSMGSGLQPWFSDGMDSSSAHGHGGMASFGGGGGFSGGGFGGGAR